MLHKWGMKDTPNCSACNIKENLRHTIWDCEIAKRTWKNFRDTLSISANDCNNFEKILLEKHRSPIINLLTLKIKNKLLKLGEEKQPISNSEIIAIIRQQYKLETTIAKTIKQKWLHGKRWTIIDKTIME